MEQDDHPRPDELVLGPLGVGEDEERIYRFLLGAPGAPVGSIEKETGLDPKRVTKALSNLAEAGFITRAGDKKQRYVALRPETVLDALAARRKAEIERSVALGAGLGQLLPGEQAEKGLVEVVTVIEGRNAMAQHCRRLQEMAETEVVVFERGPYGVPLADVSISPELEGLRRGVAYRVIYEPEALELDGAMELLERQLDAGEEARVHASLPVWLLIADRQVALVPLNTSAQSEGGAVLIHSSWLLDALITLFEALWKESVPLPTGRQEIDEGENPRSPLSELDHKILTMVAAGIKDETIAARLGYNPATVRRRISKITRLLGVQTRFQAGLMAGRKGWL